MEYSKDKQKNMMTTTFAIYDMCKDQIKNYPELSIKETKVTTSKETVHGRGAGEKVDLGMPLWQLDGAESLGVVQAVSILAREV